MKRLFIGTRITLSPYFSNLKDNLKKVTARDKITWTDSEVQHITLRFLGKTPDATIAPLNEKLEEIFSQTSRFDLEINKLGVFGSHHHPSVIWLGFNDFQPMTDLTNRLEPELLKLGFPPYEGNIVSHITLGRVKEIVDKKFFWTQFERLTPQEVQTIHIDSFTLFRSQLETAGPKYTEIKTWKLL